MLAFSFVIYCTWNPALQNQLFLPASSHTSLHVFTCSFKSTRLITCNSFDEVNWLIKKLTQMTGQTHKWESPSRISMTSRARRPGWRGWLWWLTWQVLGSSALFPTYESDTHFWVCLIVFSSASLLINRLSSLNELHVKRRVLSRLQMKTPKRVREDADKKANSAVLSLNCNVTQSKRRAWRYTTSHTRANMLRH